MAGENSNLVNLWVAQITDIEIRSIGIAKPWRAVIAAACRQSRSVEASYLFLIKASNATMLPFPNVAGSPLKGDLT